MKSNLILCALILTFLPGRAGADGFVRLSQQDGAWRFENDAGKFQSFGINGIHQAEYWPNEPGVETKKSKGYYDVRGKFSKNDSGWAASVKVRMQEWGFNTVGVWSSQELQKRGFLYCHLLKLGWSGHPNRLVDLFEPAFEKYVAKIAQAECQPRANDANLVGYFLDNELPWYGNKAWKSDKESLLVLYSRLPSRAPGREKLVEFLQDQFATWESFQKEFNPAATSWRALLKGGEIKAATEKGRELESRWAGIVAERFFSLSAAAVRNVDPHHLILGSRFAANAPVEVWRAAGKYCDVLSVNYYPHPGKLGLDRWRAVFGWTGRPLLISETSLRAAENSSNDPNRVGSGATVATQQERASALAFLLDGWIREPYIVGIHWFEYADQPPGGRSHNREDSNYGLVDIHDQPYEDVLKVWAQAVRAL